MFNLVLLRHGNSLWNQKNLFTGWVDVDLSDQGREEAKRAGELLGSAGLMPDVLFTSVLKRAINTAHIALDQIDRNWIDTKRSWRLNERHYGALQGLDAFTSTKEGAEKLEQVFAGISAAFDVVRDKILQITKSFSNFKQIFTIDFWKDTAKEIREEAAAAAELTDKLQGIADAERDLREERALQNRDLAKAKRQVEDTNLSFDERIQILDDIVAKEDALLQKELDNEKARLDAMEKLAAMSDTSAEDAEKLTQQRIKIAQLETQSDQKATEAAAKRRGLDQQRAAEIKAQADAYKKNLEDIAALELKLNMDLITDADEKARKQLELDYEANLKSIENLKLSEEKKKKLRDKALEVYEQQLEEQTQKEIDAADKAAEEIRLKKEADDKTLLDAEARRLDAKLQLTKIKNEEDLKELQETLDARMEIELSNLDLSEEEQEVVRQKYRDMRLAAEQKLTGEINENKQKEIDQAMQGLEALKTISGEETAIGKAADIVFNASKPCIAWSISFCLFSLI